MSSNYSPEGPWHPHAINREKYPIKMHTSGRLGGTLHALYMGVGIGMAGHRTLL